MGAYDISVEVAVAGAVDTHALVDLAARVMAEEGVAESTGVAILVTGDDEIRAMNRQFLGIDEPTDVLSFPDEADEFIQGAADQELLGDIAISLPTAERQAAANGIGVEVELAHLLVHGMLHLCGYDHVASGEEEAQMRAREEWYVPGVVHSAPH